MKIKVNGKKFEVEVAQVSNDGILFNINNKSYFVEKNKEIPSKKVEGDSISKKPKTTSAKTEREGQIDIHSPISGLVSEVFVKVGDEVKEGDPLVVIEAMKMQNKINAEKFGKVEEIFILLGQEIREGEKIISIS